eukprot:1148543-Rhodomonas_salina.2
MVLRRFECYNDTTRCLVLRTVACGTVPCPLWYWDANPLWYWDAECGTELVHGASSRGTERRGNGAKRLPRRRRKAGSDPRSRAREEERKRGREEEVEDGRREEKREEQRRERKRRDTEGSLSASKRSNNNFSSKINFSSKKNKNFSSTLRSRQTLSCQHNRDENNATLFLNKHGSSMRNRGRNASTGFHDESPTGFKVQGRMRGQGSDRQRVCSYQSDHMVCIFGYSRCGVPMLSPKRMKRRCITGIVYESGLVVALFGVGSRD